MGLRSNSEVRLSRKIAMVWVIIAFITTLLVGAFGKAYLLPDVLSAGTADTVFIRTIMKMYPAFIGGIFLCGILAAAMSSADSQLLVAASAFSRDIYFSFIKKDASDKQMLMISRAAVFVVAAIAFLIARNPDSSIFGLVSYAWAGFGATFGPLVLLALFWKKTSRNGALSGLIAGGITVIVWKPLSGGIFDLYEIVPGFVICFAVAVIVSLLDKTHDPEVAAEYDTYTQLGD
jgi:sodium/proline symporter